MILLTDSISQSSNFCVIVLDETTYYFTAFALDGDNTVIASMQGNVTTDFGWHPSANTVARYKFTSNANDDSGNGKNATNVGATFSSNGAYFSDYDKRIDLPSMTIGTVFTISCWCKLSSNPTINQEFEIYFDWSSSYRNLIFRLRYNTFDCWTGNNSASQNTTATYSMSDFTTWHNYILTKNGTSIKIYKDGILVASGTSPYNVSIPGGRNTITLAHNRMMDGSSKGSPGYLKDYIIENKDWTQSEITNYYNKTKNHYV